MAAQMCGSNLIRRLPLIGSPEYFHVIVIRFIDVSTFYHSFCPHALVFILFLSEKRDCGQKL